MTKKLFTLVLLIIFSFTTKANNADTSKVYVFSIDEEIAPPVVRRMNKAFAEAREYKADLIVIHMNTYGGLVVSADTIRTRILKEKTPIIVFIDNNAASAGALISIACDSIYMAPGASIGAATVVNQTAEAMPDKYQSYMRSTMRSTAEVNGRDPKIAEAMVDQDIYVEDISDSGKVLTFTTSEAIAHDFCEGEVGSIDEAIAKYGFKNYVVIEQQLKTTDHIIDWLISPYIHGLLIMIIMAGIYFEMQSPGFGVPSLAAITAAVLYFAPLYIEGLAENWEVLIFIMGLILIMLEIFIIPGFGIAGVMGIIMVIVGLVLSLLYNVVFDFSLVTDNAIMEAVFVVMIAVFGAMILTYFAIKHVFYNSKYGLSLSTQMKSDDGYTSTEIDMKSLIGKKATAATILRPSGRVYIDGVKYDAICRESYIDKSTEVEIIDFVNGQLIVVKEN
ncbi:MAG: serine protease [Bacteroidetes bacterium 4572_112]|nr:MAG: serine protease [Bacteroidetes bacterium 4572_112]